MNKKRKNLIVQYKFFILLWVICHSFHMIFINSPFASKDESDLNVEGEKLRLSLLPFIFLFPLSVFPFIQPFSLIKLIALLLRKNVTFSLNRFIASMNFYLFLLNNRRKHKTYTHLLGRQTNPTMLYSGQITWVLVYWRCNSIIACSFSNLSTKKQQCFTHWILNGSHKRALHKSDE